MTANGLARAMAPALLSIAIGLPADTWAGKTYYVDDDASGDSGAGTNWVTAKKTIQAAIALTVNGDTVLVTNGVYSTGGVTNVPPGSTLTNRVAITKAITVKAASANWADTIIQGARHPVTTNGPAAVRCVYLVSGALLCGFTLTNGHTLTSSPSVTNTVGGGACGASSGAAVSNCLIVGCSANAGGAAAYATLRRCTIAGNSAGAGGGGYVSTMDECVLDRNRALTTGSGGGAAIYSTLRRCSIIRNSSADRGGGTYASNAEGCTYANNSSIRGAHCGGLIRNCLIRNNTGSYAGGVYVLTVGAYRTVVENCTIVDNHGTKATDGVGGVAGSGPVLNSIVYYNTSVTSYKNYNSASGFTNSCTYAMPAGGTDNITNAPAFVNYAGDDFHLTNSSPCVDAGMALTGVTDDLDGVRRPLDGNGDGVPAYDMGCYEVVPPPAGSLISFK